MSVKARWAVIVVIGLIVAGGVWAAAEKGSSPGGGATTTQVAGDATVSTSAPPVSTIAPSDTTGAPGSVVPVTAETSTTAPAVAATTTTTVPEPIEERLPRTGAAATETDPVPVGEVVEAATGLWDIALTDVNLDAAGTVLAFADINPEPDPGYQDVLVTIEGTYLGNQVAQPVFEWAILAGGNEYLPSIPGCGVIPDSIYDVVEVAPGESFVAHMCMPVAAEDLGDGVQLYLVAPGDEPRYFSLR